jgi:amidase
MAALDGFATATRMLDALHARTVSAVELLDLHLARIERHNPRLNAIVIANFEAARRRAVDADVARARGENGALLGLPLTIKDCIEVAGLRCTAGAPEFAERIAAADAPLAARVLGAGGVLMGKTNVPPWAGDWQASNTIFGRTNNPWDRTRTSGGSTGGAAAVAAGLTPLEFGSDLGGSVRVPAGFCGVYGHKPSETAVPRSGHFPGWGVNPAYPFGVQGPLARSAADLELALDVIAGPEIGDEPAWRLELPPARAERLADLRVAVMPPIEWLPVQSEILAALEGLAEDLGRLRARVGVAQPETFGDMREHHALYRTLLVCGTAQASGEERRAQAADHRARGDAFSEAFARGFEANATEFVRFMSERERHRTAYRAFFREWDVLLTPSTLGEAFPHTDAPMRERWLAVDGVAVRYERQAVYPGVATLSGQPATSFPVGVTRAGLPIGLQAIGPYLEDRTPIRFAGMVGRELGGFRPPPACA